MTAKKSFATLFLLRPIEWVPIVAAVLINVSTGLYVMYEMEARIGSAATTPRSYFQDGTKVAPDLSSRIFDVGRFVTGGLLVLGGGCWLWRANQWFRQRD